MWADLEPARVALAAGIRAHAQGAHPDLERSVHNLVADAMRAGLEPTEVVSIAWAAWRVAGGVGLLRLGCGHRISSVRLVGDSGSCCTLCVAEMASAPTATGQRHHRRL